MKWFLVVLVLFLAVAGARADGPDDQYVTIYNLIQEADALNNRGQFDRALPKYREAQAALVTFQKGYPDWNASVVSFRLKYVTSAISGLAAKAPAVSAPAPSPAPQKQAEAPAPAPAAPSTPAPPADWENQLSGLGDQVRHLQEDNASLQAKLKEALAAQPGTIDPRQLARADERIKQLLKDNDLLKVSLDQEKAKSTPGASRKALEEARQALERANRDLAEQTKRANTLEKERTALQAKLKNTPPSSNNAGAVEQTRKELDNAKRKLAEQTELASNLAKERDVLKQQLSTAKEDLKSAQASASGKSDVAKQIKKLQQERDELQKKLEAAAKELDSRKRKTAGGKVVEMEKTMASMRARLDVLEATPVPYTPEEAALFRVPASRPVETVSKAATKASKELPADTVALSAEAKRYYTAGQLDKAEDRYVQVLREDRNHVPTLANLAGVELELNHLPEAETNILQALALAPNDPACLVILGHLRFRQTQYDAAFDALSRAAKAEPRNAEAQNYLGLTLSAKGMRGPAETALRKAIQLEPRYAEAHNNLAVIYATQKPPLLELARWHYQRGLDAGGKPNPDLEKLLDIGKAAEAAH